MVSDRVQIKVWSETLVSDQSKVNKAKQSRNWGAGRSLYALPKGLVSVNSAISCCPSLMYFHNFRRSGKMPYSYIRPTRATPVVNNTEMFHTYWCFTAFVSTVDVYIKEYTWIWFHKIGTLHVLGRRRYHQQHNNTNYCWIHRRHICLRLRNNIKWFGLRLKF